MFYNIKEIESQASKFTGVHVLQIKDLLQSLVDDDLVNAEKCGVTTLYWCFEYDKLKKMKSLVDTNEQKLRELSGDAQNISDKIKVERKRRTKGNSQEMLKQIHDLKKQKEELKETMSSSAFDIGRVESIKKALHNEIANGEICADNIESLVYYFQKNNGISRDLFRQELNIPEEFKEFPNINEIFARLT